MPIKNGDTVRAHYTGTLADGTEFDSSRGRAPLEFIMGEHMLIAGFERAVLGRTVGEKVNVSIPPAEAYGEMDEELLFEVPRSEVPPHITPEPGLQLSLNSPEGDMEVTIAHVDEHKLVLDGNHPLAGKELNFEIEIVSVVKRG